MTWSPSMWRTSLIPLYDTQSQCCFFLVNVNILYYHYCTCYVFGKIKLLEKNSKSVWSHDPVVMSLSHDIAIVVVWIPSDCLEINNSNVHLNNVSYWRKTLGRWQYESRNSSQWKYKFKKSRDKIKKPRNHQGRNPSFFGLRVATTWFFSGGFVGQNTSLGGFYYGHHALCKILKTDIQFVEYQWHNFWVPESLNMI